MTIYCKLCNHRVESRKELPENQSEESDVLESLSRHLVYRHPHEGLKLKEDIESIPLLIATYLLLKHYAKIPAESHTLQVHFDENEQLLLGLFDIEVTKAS